MRIIQYFIKKSNKKRGRKSSSAKEFASLWITYENFLKKVKKVEKTKAKQLDLNFFS
jgi:hypothetical protein